jgi:hypothetical protein
MLTTRRSVLAGGSLMASAAVGGVSALALVAPQAAISQAAQSTPDFDHQLAYQHGIIEAVLWSMPAMSDVFFRQSLFKNYGTPRRACESSVWPLVLLPPRGASRRVDRHNIANTVYALGSTS